MTTVLFPSPVTTFTLDPAERAIYVGTSASMIHQFNLIRSVDGKYQGIGGDPTHPSQQNEQNDIVGHTSEITAISTRFDGTLLVTGDKAGEILVWDVGTRQVLRKVKGQNGRHPKIHANISADYKHIHVSEKRRRFPGMATF